MFADDANIFKAMTNFDDYNQFKQDISNLQAPANKCQMVFNAGKCKVMHIGRYNPDHESWAMNIA